MNNRKTPEAARREIARLTFRTGRGRDRAFAEAVDLSPEGVNVWRRSVGLPELPPPEPRPESTK